MALLRHPAQARLLARAVLGRVVLIGLLLSPAACSLPRFLVQPPQARGNQVDADAIKQLVPGTSTRADVTSLLGSPTAHATFDDNTWLYISEVTRPVIAGTQGVRDQSVYVLTFNDAGTLTGVTKRTMDDRQPVDVVSRTTPSPGSEASFFQQLFGNIGKFSPGAGLGSSKSSLEPGPTNPGNF